MTAINPIIRLVRHAQLRANAPRIRANPNPYGVLIQRDIPYRDDGNPDHLLDVYSPSGDALPVIIEIHGGGYLSCNKEINAQHGQYLASRGFHVVNMNYTLCPEGSLSTIPNELADVADWVGENAAAYGFQKDKLLLTGDSAGGHIALMAMAMFTTGRAADFFGVRRPSVTPVGCAVSCPEGSFDPRHIPPNFPAWMLFLLLHKYTFNKEYVRHSSYEYYMDGNYPPVWLCTSPTDSLLYSHTRRMHEYMQEKGYAHTYREYTGGAHRLDHAFNILNPDWPESRAANDDIIAYFNAVR